MIKFFINNYKHFDKKILHILKIGLGISFLICIISSLILLTYVLFFTYPILYYTGFLLFLLGLNFAISFIISATIIDKFKKQYI